VGTGAAPAGETGTRDRHAAFLQAAAGPQAAAPAASQVQRPASPYQIMAGTLIPATLVTGINSDLPGEVVAQVTRNVYDTQQRHLLIPAGSKVLGKVDNQVGLGQARVNIAWFRIIFPNNASLALPGFGGVDGQGAAGIRDRVNNHYGRTYLNALLLSAITAGVQLSQPQGGGVFAQPSPGQVAAGALGQQMGEVSSEAIRRNMQVGPTLEVRTGFRFSIYVSRDLVLEPYDHGGAR
ncbi:MAG TPA: TrbI/VirB10 family protein, partial [Longimicrobiaceae bacterium]|nr:TrbI/VirB10 family protein [Longimicrobiaceae bacterium]